MKTDPRLAAELENFRFDDGTPQLTFAARLAGENQWDSAFTARVLREYLRYVYLASIVSEPVTPSVAVDQAWHLHLCYTRSYWNDLCGRVLGKPLHHGPTRGGREENLKYREQYERTLALYETEFGATPTSDIWPPSAVRFSPAAQPAWFTPERFWIVERSRAKQAGRLGVIATSVIFCSGAAARADGTIFVIFLSVVLGVSLLAWVVKKRGKGGPGSCGTSCGSSSSGDGGGDGHGHGGSSGCGSDGGGCGGGGD